MSMLPVISALPLTVSVLISCVNVIPCSSICQLSLAYDEYKQLASFKFRKF